MNITSFIEMLLRSKDMFFKRECCQLKAMREQERIIFSLHIYDPIKVGLQVSISRIVY